MSQIDTQGIIVNKIINKTVHLLGNRPLSPDEAKTKILLDIGVDVDSADNETLRGLLRTLDGGWPEKTENQSTKLSPSVSDINIEDLEDISIIDPLGVIRSDYKLISRQPDRNGLVSVIDKSGKNITRIHPTRISETGQDGSIAIDYGDKLVAACPKCGSIRKVRQSSGKCACGKFKVVRVIAHELPSAKSTRKRSVETVDLNELATKGELWIKNGIQFDDPNTEVTAASYRVGNYYLSFNLYNGSLGKKKDKGSKQQRILDLQNGVTGNPKGPPYKVKSLDDWRKKLASNGYKQFQPSK